MYFNIFGVWTNVLSIGGEGSPMAYENLDKKLVNELNNDGRASLRSLSEEFNVSVTTISNYIADLENDEIIEGYTPIVNYGEIGYDITAIVQLKIEGESIPGITDDLLLNKHMMTVFEVTGDHDIVAIGKFSDTDHMNDEIKQLLMKPEIKESNTSIVLNTVIEDEDFALEY